MIKRYITHLIPVLIIATPIAAVLVSLVNRGCISSGTALGLSVALGLFLAIVDTQIFHIRI